MSWSVNAFFKDKPHASRVLRHATIGQFRYVPGAVRRYILEMLDGIEGNDTPIHIFGSGHHNDAPNNYEQSIDHLHVKPAIWHDDVQQAGEVQEGQAAA